MSEITEGEALEVMLAIVRDHDLDALTVRVGKATYELVAHDLVVASVAYMAPLAHAQSPTTTAAVVGAPVAGNAKKVTAPIIGVFYGAPAPGTDSFVRIGDRVEVGQVLCILEAMKLMNEITSDYAGVVRRILPENGALVSLGEEMFWIDP
jgi:acetyl-CoA carboxylase biotin carboxyl carrier protein